MENNDKTKEYFEREYGDFDASYNNPQKLKDIVRILSYRFSKKWINGRLNSLLDLIGDNIRNAKILEVGCGPGNYSIRLAQKGADITAIDYSKGMIDIAKKNSKSAEVSINFITVNFMDFVFSNTFDYVFATGVFDYIERPQQKAFLKRMADLSNQYVIVSFPKKYSYHALIRILWLFLFKKIKTFYFTNKDIFNLSSDCNLKEIERRDVGILWVVKFKKEIVNG